MYAQQPMWPAPGVMDPNAMGTPPGAGMQPVTTATTPVAPKKGSAPLRITVSTTISYRSVS